MVPVFLTTFALRNAPSKDRRQMYECLRVWLPRMCQQVVQRCRSGTSAGATLTNPKQKLSAPIRTAAPRNPRCKNLQCNPPLFVRIIFTDDTMGKHNLPSLCASSKLAASVCLEHFNAAASVIYIVVDPWKSRRITGNHNLDPFWVRSVVP